MAKTAFIATGRRKKSVARVRLVPGTGAITINRRDVEEYFGLETLKMIVRAPMTLTNTLEKYDVLVNVYGGGTTPRPQNEGAQEVRSACSPPRASVQQALTRTSCKHLPRRVLVLYTKKPPAFR